MSNCYTISRDYLLFELISEIGVSERPVPGRPAPRVASFRGIWDTGASASVITEHVVSSLGLAPSGQKRLSTANGVTVRPTYFVDFHLPNGVTVQKIEAASMPTVSGGFDALIGMDVICLGDFSITNYEGKTTFSFRTPSQATTDFVAEQRAANIRIYDKSRSRNSRVKVYDPITKEERELKWKEAKSLIMEGWLLMENGRPVDGVGRFGGA